MSLPPLLFSPYAAAFAATGFALLSHVCYAADTPLLPAMPPATPPPLPLLMPLLSARHYAIMPLFR